MQIGSFIASLVLGVIALIQLYSKKYGKQASADCKDSFEVDISAEDVASVCRTALNVSKAAITATYAVIWLIQFCTFDGRDSYCSESDKYSPTDGVFIVHRRQGMNLMAMPILRTNLHICILIAPCQRALFHPNCIEPPASSVTVSRSKTRGQKSTTTQVQGAFRMSRNFSTETTA